MVWSAALTTLIPLSVTLDDTVGVKKDLLADLGVVGDWYFANDVLYLYSESDPDSAYTTITASDSDPTTNTSSIINIIINGTMTISPGGNKTITIGDPME